jgi:general secretion pathway protein F
MTASANRRSLGTIETVQSAIPFAVTFEYSAVRLDGSIEHGTVSAITRDHARENLDERGLFPVVVRQQSGAPSGRRPMRLTELAFGLRMLADFLDSGLPLTRALAALSELGSPSWKTLLPVVGASVRRGERLSVAISSGMYEVSPVVIAMLEAGEGGSGLAAAIRKASELIEETVALRAALRAALAYPLLLLVAGTMSLAVLVGVVIPRFAAILSDYGQSLPMSTRLMLTVAALARHGLLPVALTIAATIAAWRLTLRTDAGRHSWHSILLTVPLLGETRRATAMTRCCTAMSALLQNGVAVTQAMTLGARATGDAELSHRILQARQAVIRGEGLSRAMEESRAVTSTVLRLIRAAEEHGRLPEMLSYASKLERERAINRTQSAIRLLEPTLIMVFGGLVALVAAALLQAVYSVRPS